MSYKITTQIQSMMAETIVWFLRLLLGITVSSIH
uniref:GDP-mannose 4,6 dehydratase 2 n=1 Tax=Arundo donax TaxID=35708 RepID=A0A0A9FST4_ARUDO